MSDTQTLEERQAQTEETRRVCMGLAEAIQKPYNLEAIPDFIVEDYIQHVWLCGDGRQEMIDLTKKTLIDAHPDHIFEMIFFTADGDMAMAYWHLKPSPTDPSYAITDIWRVEDGMIVEHWGNLQELPADDDPAKVNPRPAF